MRAESREEESKREREEEREREKEREGERGRGGERVCDSRIECSRGQAHIWCLHKPQVTGLD